MAGDNLAVGKAVFRNGKRDNRRAVTRHEVAPAWDDAPRRLFGKAGETRGFQHVAGLLRRLKHRRGGGYIVEERSDFLLHLNHSSDRRATIAAIASTLLKFSGMISVAGMEISNSSFSAPMS